MFVMFCKSFFKKMLKLDSEKFSLARSGRHMCSFGMLEIETCLFNKVPMPSVMFLSPLLSTMKVEIGAGCILIGSVGCFLWEYHLIFVTHRILRPPSLNGAKSLVGRKRMRSRVLVKARVTELDEVPKSIRWSEGERFEED